ncbi:MAG: hypothetical protein ACYC35_12450 [Pirellulales bacterium]
MPGRVTHLMMVTLWLLGCFLLAPSANLRAAAPEAAPAPALGELPALARAAKGQFVPTTEADVEKARQILVAALARLDQYLATGGARGVAWKEFLTFPELAAQLDRAAKPDPAVLERIGQRYASWQFGLELPHFVEVRQAIQSYADRIRAANRPSAKAEFESDLESLAARLETYAKNPAAPDAAAIGAVLGRLERDGQTPSLVAAVRAHLCRPNLFVVVSNDIVGAGVAAPTEETAPVEDVILGTRIAGTGRTTGFRRVELVPDADRAIFDILFDLTTASDTVGRNGPVQIDSGGITRLAARKRMLFDQEGLRALNASSAAVTNTQVRGVSPVRDGIGSRLVQRVAWNRVCQEKAQAEQIAAQHAEWRANERIDRDAAEMLAKTNKGYAERVRNPLVRRGGFPSQFRCSTSRDQLQLALLEAGPFQSAATSAPPDLTGPSEMTLRVHESAINNFASSALAGRTLDEAGLHAWIVEMAGSLPERLKRAPDEEPWEITFPREQPVTIAFADQGFRLAIHGQQYVSGSRRYQAMDVSADYKFEATAGGIKAVRQGELRIFPPGFVPGAGKRLGARQTALRSLLAKRLGKFLEPEMIGSGLILPGRWSQAGKLRVSHFSSQGGWLTLVWKRETAGVQTVATIPEKAKP